MPEVIFYSPCNTKQKQSPLDDKVEEYDYEALDDNDQHQRESGSDECDAGAGPWVQQVQPLLYQNLP